ncbi:MAG: hypothetical protein WEE89_21155, partial [Gemmatimonadota bacterium]
MKRIGFDRQLGRSIASAAMVVAALATLGATALPGPDDPTFTRDIAPIMQAKCQVCHRPNSIAPMSLLTYQDVKPFAFLIKNRVQSRTMPPWHIDKSVGIRDFKNDRSLSDAEINTIVKWVDAGAPMGDARDLPKPVEWPDPTLWELARQFGPPDLVVKSKPYTVRASGQDVWWRPAVETGVTEPRWVRAIEVKPSFPGGRKVVHHVLTMLEQNEQGLTNMASTAHAAMPRMTAGLFMEWAVGKTGEIFNQDAGKLILPGSRIRWEVHYYTIGQVLKDDVVELGVWYYPKDYAPKNRTVLRMFNAAGGNDLDIPPNEKSMSQEFFVLAAPARIENFQPHMHMRGKAFSMEAVYPDGRKELLSMVSNFQWRWHVNYIY